MANKHSYDLPDLIFRLEACVSANPETLTYDRVLISTSEVDVRLTCEHQSVQAELCNPKLNTTLESGL